MEASNQPKGIIKLPKEIFISIISRLETRDDLTCICVSRYWHEIIRSNCLYQDLVFVSGDAGW